MLIQDLLLPSDVQSRSADLGTAFVFGGNVAGLSRTRGLVLLFFLLSLSQSLFTQVLFPGNALERRSRTYHVVHYKLVVSFDEREKKVEGTTSITFTPLTERLDSLLLDAEQMEITSVSLSNGRPLRFSNRSPQLAVFFDPPPGLDDTSTISVKYSCTPKSGLYFIQPDSTDPDRHCQIWSQGEDTDNHFWFPCYDYPNDKATSEVIATVPESYVLLSNGKLISSSHDAKRKTRTFHWSETKPHSSYLIMIAAGEYQIVHDHCGTLPLEYYVYKDRVEDGVRSFSSTPAAMKFFQEKIGVPYPWEKYAQIWISNFMWGGMENTSAVTMNDNAYLLDPRAAVDFTSADVVAHELAHQWWGDLVTSRDWNHLWLHEGFANYFEALFKQHEKGDDYFQYDLMQQASSVFSTERAHGRHPLVGKDGYTANTYSKGCWVLHMLRNILGEKVFWKALNYYARRFAFRNVDSHEFMLAIEDATGKNVTGFFLQWVYMAGHPDVRVTKTWDDSSNVLHLTFTQTQVMDSLTGVFSFPLSIECTTESGVKTVAAFIEKQDQEVAIPLPGRPIMTVVDKGKNALATFHMERKKEENIYLLQHAPDITDRIAVARSLQSDDNDTVVFRSLRDAALHDSFWAVRNEAVLSLSSSENPDVKETLFKASRDVHSSVRTSAITGLSRFSTPDVADSILQSSSRDSSLLVLCACIRTLAAVDSVRGFDLAVRYVGMKSYRDIVRRTALDVMLDGSDSRSIPFAITYSAVSNPGDIRRLSMRILGRFSKTSPEAKDRLIALVNDGVVSVRKAAVEGLASSGNQEVTPVLQGRKLVENDEGVKKAIDQALEAISGGSNPGSAHGK